MTLLKQSAGEQVTVTDLLGREVTVPAEVEKVVAIGPGALRLYVYAGVLDYDRRSRRDRNRGQ